MAKITKHPRESGAITVKQDGKIFSNIGRGKDDIPTAQNSSIQKMTTVETDILSKSTILMAQQKMDNLSQNKISFEQAQTLWNLTIEQNLVERLNTLGNYIDNMSPSSQRKLLTNIENDMLQSMYDNTPPMIVYEQFKLALNGRSPEGNISTNVLDAFARHPRNDWKVFISQNLHTTPETLAILAENEDNWLLTNVVENHNTTSEILEKIFVKTKHLKTLASIAKNEKTSQKTLEKLAKSEFVRLRLGVAMNENTPIKILSILSVDSNNIVREAVARNWNTPPKILDCLSQDSDTSIVWYVADNRNTPHSTLERLAKNSNNAVAQAAEFGLRYLQNSYDRDKQ